MRDPLQTLKQTLGFESFLPGQKQVIESILAGRSALAIFPTGQRKSLCFQLPALHLANLTLVVSPLMALMKDQVDFLLSRGIAATRLDSSLEWNKINTIYQQLHRNELKLLYVAHERFANEHFVGIISKVTISLMVIDEAHCISEWGHNFIPDYLKLTELAHKFAVPVIVYVTMQKTAEKIAAMLVASGYEAKAYHAGLKNVTRKNVQEWFMESNRAIVVATIAFSMGIDKSDIRNVYHYNLPKSLENYSQEIGRAGRDGEPSTCTLLGGGNDLLVLENFVHGDTPDTEMLCACISHILGLGDTFDIAVYGLGGLFDIRPLVIKTLLTDLELEGVIRSTGPFYSSYKFKPLKTSAEIFSRLNEEQKQYLRSNKCEHCSFCITGSNQTVKRQDNGGNLLDQMLLNDLSIVRNEFPEALATPRQMSRFLCGLTSPMLTRNKLGKHSLFGKTAHTSFGQVMDWLTVVFN